MATGTKIGDLFFDVSADTAKALTGITKAGTQLGASLTSTIGRGIGRTISAITEPIVNGLESAATAGAAVFGTVLATGFTRLRAIDDAQGKLRALGHTTEEVAGIMDSALQAVLGTQYNLGEAATIAASAVAAGIKPGAELTNYLSLIADTATVAGISLESAGAIINKTTAFQRVYLREINQLAQRGIPIFTWLQEEYGVTGEKLRKMVSDGEVDAATFQRVIQERIGGAAVEFGLTTFSGALRNTFAAMGRLGETLLGPFFGLMRDFAFPALINLFDELNAIVKPAIADFIFSPTFAAMVDFFKELPDNVRPFIDALKEIGPILAPLSGAFAALGLGGLKKFLGPLGMILPRINPVVGALIGLITVSKDLRDSIGEAFGTVAEAFGRFGGDGAQFKETINEIVEVVGTVLGKGLVLGAQGIAFLIDTFREALPHLTKFFKSLQTGFAGDFAGDGDEVAKVADRIREAFLSVVEWFKKNWPTIRKVAETVVDGVAKAIQWVVDEVVPLLVDGFQEAVSWVKTNWPTIKNVVKTVVDAVGTAIRWVIDNVVPALINAFNAVVLWVRTNWPQIRQTVTDVVGGIVMVIQWFTTNILPHLISGFQAVWSFVQEVWPQIVSTIKNAVELIAAVIGVTVTAIMWIWDHFGQNIINAVETAWGLITGLIQAALDVIQGIINVALGILTLDWDRVWNGIKQILAGVWEAMVALIDYGINTAKDIISLAISALGAIWDLGWAAMKLALETAWTGIITFIGNIPGWIEDVFAAAITLLFDAGRFILEGLWNGIKWTWDLAWNWLGNIATWIKDRFNDAKDWLYDIGRSILQGLWDGMKSLLPDVNSWLDSLGEKFRLHKGPPAKDAVMLTGNGELIMQGLLAGIQQGWMDVERFLDSRTAMLNNGSFDIAVARSTTMTPETSAGGASSAPLIGQLTIDARGATDPQAVGTAAQQGVLQALAQYTRARG